MLIHDSCEAATRACLDTQTFAAARLCGETALPLHTHDCCELCYAAAGARRLQVNGALYEMRPGDLFFLRPGEPHGLLPPDAAGRERQNQPGRPPRRELIVLSIWPAYLRALSSPQTPLGRCFFFEEAGFARRLRLSGQERRRLLAFLHALAEPQPFGQDLLERAGFVQLMAFLNQCLLTRGGAKSLPAPAPPVPPRRAEVDEILRYIDQHLTEPLSIPQLSARFYLSGSYLCRIFKRATGTTVNRYITAKRITRAKALLSKGYTVAETAALCGFGDYSNFLKAFTKSVGMSPKQYASRPRP